MPGPQAYVAVVDPTSGIVQEYVTLVDSSGNNVYAASQSPQGRLTLTTAVPVLTADVATSANVLYTPYLGNIIPLWNSTISRFVPEVFTELTNVLANSSTGNAGPAAGAASENYDLFVWKSGTSIFLTRGPVWTNATTRSAGTALARVQGYLVNNVAITNGPAAQAGTYVGTVRTDASGATVSWSLGGAAAGGTPATLHLWNMYNRVTLPFLVRDTTASWNYTSSNIQATNNSTGNRVSFVRGLNEGSVLCINTGFATLAAAIAAFGQLGIALDVVNAYNAAPVGRASTNVAVADSLTVSSIYSNYPGLGFHFLSGVESGDGTNTTTWTGNALALQALRGEVPC